MKFVFILVEPAVEENIGAAARAIKTMGFRNLRLINPKANYLGEKSKMLAHGSLDILESAEIFENLKSCIDDLDFIVGTSSKKRKTHEDNVNCENLKDIIKSKSMSVHTTGIVFGSEESGLDTDHLMLCDVISYIPLTSPYPSLNLSQAVMIYAYLLTPLIINKNDVNPEKKTESLKSLKEKIKAILEFTDINNRQVIAPRILERITFLNDDDIQLMHSFCNAFNKKIRNQDIP